jgi:hypothetical protein
MQQLFDECNADAGCEFVARPKPDRFAECGMFPPEFYDLLSVEQLERVRREMIDGTKRRLFFRHGERVVIAERGERDGFPLVRLCSARWEVREPSKPVPVPVPTTAVPASWLACSAMVVLVLMAAAVVLIGGKADSSESVPVAAKQTPAPEAARPPEQVRGVDEGRLKQLETSFAESMKQLRGKVEKLKEENDDLRASLDKVVGSQAELAVAVQGRYTTEAAAAEKKRIDDLLAAKQSKADAQTSVKDINEKIAAFNNGLPTMIREQFKVLLGKVKITRTTVYVTDRHGTTYPIDRYDITLGE